MGSLPVNSRVSGVVVDPRNPKIVFAAGFAGVFRSDDSGLTWQPSNKGLADARVIALALNPSKPDMLFAATADGAIFRSDDGGESWNSVSANR